MLHLHTKVSTDHGCGNLSVLVERTQIGLLEDISIDPELLGIFPRIACVAGRLGSGKLLAQIYHQRMDMI